MAHISEAMKTSTERSRERRERNQAWLKSQQTPCLFCGTDEQIEWHHKNGNDKTITISGANNMSKIKNDINDCWCLCKTCHSQLHRGLVIPMADCY